jgi:hypothetical protein
VLSSCSVARDSSLLLELFRSSATQLGLSVGSFKESAGDPRTSQCAPMLDNSPAAAPLHRLMALVDRLLVGLGGVVKECALENTLACLSGAARPSLGLCGRIGRGTVPCVQLGWGGGWSFAHHAALGCFRLGVDWQQLLQWRSAYATGSAAAIASACILEDVWV